ncbi:C40 family peptidase [Nocardioides sp. R-C-SC26]|uniref:C40 family peptidase n=1 Tax=Nocardioides sp. R-C-SC26 TaxID=2870414 RepID=UPI001E4B27C4|nr:C40 family peptidase [Nocardioides sp. R-C-SC26]
MTSGRKRIATAISGLALAATIGLVPVSPAGAEPDIEDVQARVDRLYREAEQASERYNETKIELSTLKKDLASLKADQEFQDRQLGWVRREVRESVLRQYTGGTLSVVGQVINSGSPSAFLSQMSTMSNYQRIQRGIFEEYEAALKALNLRKKATQARLDQLGQAREQLAEDKATVDAKLADAQEALEKLEAEERDQILSRGGLRAPSDVPVSGRAAAAVQFALSQVGDAYVYGAAGPSAWDCSGLTMVAWAQAGVSLPHSSSAQYGTGTHVAASDLQPGDLVFYYSPISHVGMYIGNGLIAHAANPSAGVRVSDLYSMPYVGAVRPG